LTETCGWLDARHKRGGARDVSQRHEELMMEVFTEVKPKEEEQE